MFGFLAKLPRKKNSEGPPWYIPNLWLARISSPPEFVSSPAFFPHPAIPGCCGTHCHIHPVLKSLLSHFPHVLLNHKISKSKSSHLYQVIGIDPPAGSCCQQSWHRGRLSAGMSNSQAPQTRGTSHPGSHRSEKRYWFPKSYGRTINSVNFAW